MAVYPAGCLPNIQILIQGYLQYLASKLVFVIKHFHMTITYPSFWRL